LLFLLDRDEDVFPGRTGDRVHDQGPNGGHLQKTLWRSIQ